LLAKFSSSVCTCDWSTVCSWFHLVYNSTTGVGMQRRVASFLSCDSKVNRQPPATHCVADKNRFIVITSRCIVASKYTTTRWLYNDSKRSWYLMPTDAGCSYSVSKLPSAVKGNTKKNLFRVHCVTATLCVLFIISMWYCIVL
jgi:hypothetical protein